MEPTAKRWGKVGFKDSKFRVQINLHSLERGKTQGIPYLHFQIQDLPFRVIYCLGIKSFFPRHFQTQSEIPFLHLHTLFIMPEDTKSEKED